jgi:hypothetical protein
MLPRLTLCTMFSLSVSLLACDADDPPDEEFTKEEAAEVHGKADGRDLCQDFGWYGDGICDTFCLKHDPDCGPEPQPDICETNGWYGDGICDRVCAMPDPDCQVEDGCTHNAQCSPGQLCQFTIGAACGSTGELGECKSMPPSQFCPTQILEVCGCDGSTYDNECLARAAATSVAHQGPCN